MLQRDVWHILTKSGKIVGPAEPTEVDGASALNAANGRSEAQIYGPYQLKHYRLVTDVAERPARIAELEEELRLVLRCLRCGSLTVAYTKRGAAHCRAGGRDEECGGRLVDCEQDLA